MVRMIGFNLLMALLMVIFILWLLNHSAYHPHISNLAESKKQILNEKCADQYLYQKEHATILSGAKYYGCEQNYPINNQDVKSY